MIRWFNKLIWRLCRSAWDRHDEFMDEERSKARNTLRLARISRGAVISNTSWPTDDSVKEQDQLRATSMNFKLYHCVGGHILETSTYNNRNDEHNHTLYMVHEDEDFAKQVAQAIMLEQMKQ